MNSSDGFSSDELEALAPWHLPEVSDPKPGVRMAVAWPHPAPAEAPARVEPDSHLKSLEAMRRQAYEEGFEQGRREGYDAGYHEGFATGLENGRDEHVRRLRENGAAFARLMEALNEPFRELDEAVERELVSLALAVAKQLVRRELKTDPGQVVATVREAITALPSNTRKISLFLHPEDAELVRSALALDEFAPAWEIVEDPLLSRGGCRVDTATSRVDATHEKRVYAVIATILGGDRDGDPDL